MVHLDKMRVARNEVDCIRETTLMKTIIEFPLLSHPDNPVKSPKGFFHFLQTKKLFFEISHTNFFNVFNHFILLENSIYESKLLKMLCTSKMYSLKICKP